MKNIESLVRKNIKLLKAYSSARSLYKSGTLIDANENPYNLFAGEAAQIAVNRYPDGSNEGIRKVIGDHFNIPFRQVSVGNGSDELIDLLIRIFCVPGHDEILICPPTFGMYKVAAQLNDIAINEVPLLNYDLDLHGIEKAVTEKTKIIFVCNPNNPTGTVVDREKIKFLAAKLNLIVVVDEAYADFMDQESALSLLETYPNLVVLRTLSKAYALAGARLGMAFSQEYLISLLQKIKFPYNVNSLTGELVLKVFHNYERIESGIRQLIEGRRKLDKELSGYEDVLEILPSEANFLCVRFKNSDFVFKALIAQNIIARQVNPANGMENMIRISVGTREENTLLISVLDTILERKQMEKKT